MKLQELKSHLEGAVYYLILGGFLIAIAFFTGRCSAPTQHLTIDSLNHQVEKLQVIQGKQEERARYLQQSAQREQDGKLEFKRKYEQAIAENAKLTKDQKVAKAKEVLKVGEWDMSDFTIPAADAVLNLGEKNSLLENNANADSATIKNLQWSFTELDSALRTSDEVVDKKDAIISEQKVEIKRLKRKPHWWELPLIGIAAVGGFVLGVMASN